MSIYIDMLSITIHYSRNVAFKANVMSQAVLEAQSSFVTPETMDQEASSQRCSLNDGDVVCNADLYYMRPNGEYRPKFAYLHSFHKALLRSSRSTTSCTSYKTTSYKY